MPVTAVSDSAAFRGLLTLVAHTGFSYKTRCDRSTPQVLVPTFLLIWWLPSILWERNYLQISTRGLLEAPGRLRVVRGNITNILLNCMVGRGRVLVILPILSIGFCIFILINNLVLGKRVIKEISYSYFIVRCMT